MSVFERAGRAYRSFRQITISNVKSITVQPSVSKAFYEMLIHDGVVDYKIVLNNPQLLQLLRSASDAIKGLAPKVEERATSMLPQNPGNMILVRLPMFLRKTPFPPGKESQALYLELIKAWREGFYRRYAVGTAQQLIRVEAVRDFLKTQGIQAMIKSPFQENELLPGDLLLQRVSGTIANLGRPYYVESVNPLRIRGA